MNPFDEVLMDEEHMPVMVIGGVAAGLVVVVPQKANTCSLMHGSGFKPVASPTQEPEIDAENVQQYTLHKIEWPGSDGITKAIAVGAEQEVDLPAALEILFKGYQLSLLTESANEPKVH